MPVPPTWEDRELSVLRAIIEIHEEDQDVVRTVDIAERTGFDVADVKKSLIALNDSGEGYFGQLIRGGGNIHGVLGPTAMARRAAGNWPTPELLADRLIAAFEQAAAEAGDNERGSRLHQAAAILGGTARDIVVQVAATAIGQHL